MPKGRPTKDPRGYKRVKLQPWVHKDTERAIRVDAIREKETIGEVLDRWFRERAQQMGRIAATLTKRVDATQNRDNDTLNQEERLLDDNGEPIL